MSRIASEADLAELRRIAAQVRRLILETIHHAGAGHIGGPLSVTDILTSLYFREMNIDPQRPDDPERDRFILSKGHSAVALYTVMALRGYLPVDELKTFDKYGSRLQAHPDMTLLPGLDMSSGSLGQGISAAVGMALGAKLTGRAFRVYCVIGDGESQEGQVWEAADIASKNRLDNLLVVMDYNKLQQFGWPGEDGNKRRSPVDSPADRWRSFGWHVIEADGHDMGELLEAYAGARRIEGQPTIVIAHTVKGKGVSFMENNYVWHAKVPNAEELRKALEEIGQGVES